MQNGLLLGGIQLVVTVFLFYSWGAIFLCEKLPTDGCELVLAIHRSRAAIDALPFELRAKRSWLPTPLLYPDITIR